MRAKTVATLYIEAERKGSQPFKVIREDWMSYYCSNECGITTNRAKDARFTSLPETSTVKLIPASPLWRVQSTEHLIRKPSNHFSKSDQSFPTRIWPQASWGLVWEPGFVRNIRNLVVQELMSIWRSKVAGREKTTDDPHIPSPSFSSLPPPSLLSLGDKTWLLLPPALWTSLSLNFIPSLSLSPPCLGRICEAVREEVLWRADKLVDGC